MKKLLASLVLFACGPREKLDPKNSDLALEPLPAPAGTASVGVRQIRGTAPDDVWAIALSTVEGKSGRELFAQGYHFDGTAWSYVAVPGRVTAIAPVAKNDVWAVGRYGTVAHWDGSAWHEDKLPVDWDLVDVAAAGGQVWVADATNSLHHFDGKRWDVVKPSVFARSKPTELFAVGGQVYAPASYQKDIAVAHFDGADWRLEKMDGDLGVVHLAGSAPNDVWAFPVYGSAFHFDGKSWRKTETPATDKDYLISAAAVAPNEAWAVGERGLVLRWDGQSWRRVASGTKSRLWAVWSAPGGPTFIGGDLGMLRAKR